MLGKEIVRERKCTHRSSASILLQYNTLLNVGVIIRIVLVWALRLIMAVFNENTLIGSELLEKKTVNQSTTTKPPDRLRVWGRPLMDQMEMEG